MWSRSPYAAKHDLILHQIVANVLSEIEPKYHPIYYVFAFVADSEASMITAKFAAGLMLSSHYKHLIVDRLNV